ncbi:hypothetical protein TNCV_1956531 [Trichonephila clavipes]|nr:hypothetical protein TNCV_1956531 [Trichonephila clavipes]
MCTAVIDYHERKILSHINVSEKAGGVKKFTNALDVRRLPAPLKTSKMFLQRTNMAVVALFTRGVLTSVSYVRALMSQKIRRVVGADARKICHFLKSSAGLMWS